VDLIVGNTVQVDEGNRYFFAGKIEEETIKGWGFPRRVHPHPNLLPEGEETIADPHGIWKFRSSTDAPKVNRFITLGGEPYFIRYNSRLPIVVYVPEGVEVRYRI
jgi:ecotin